MVPDIHPPRSHGPMNGEKWSQKTSKTHFLVKYIVRHTDARVGTREAEEGKHSSGHARIRSKTRGLSRGSPRRGLPRTSRVALYSVPWKMRLQMHSVGETLRFKFEMRPSHLVVGVQSMLQEEFVCIQITF